jgi:hypothetical protein
MTHAATMETLLALCRWNGGVSERLHAGSSQPVDWDQLAELAALHGVIGLVQRRLLAGDAHAPEGARQRIQAAASQVAFDGMLHARQLGQVIEALRAAGVEAMALKGVALADMLYDDVLVRPSTDLDILVRPEELVTALDVLCSVLGARTPPAEVVAFQRRHSYDVGCALPPAAGQTTLLEVHWQLAPSGLFALDLAAWRRRAQPFDLHGAAVLRLAAEEQLLHLALHMRKHRYVGLRWLADCATLVGRFGDKLDWDYVAASARQAGLRTLVYTTLTLAVQLLGAACPDGVLQRLAPSSLRRRALHSTLAQIAALEPLETQDAGWTRLAPAEVLLLDRPAAMARELRFRLFPPPEKLAGFDGAGGARHRLSLYAGRLAQRTTTLLRRP